MPLTLRFPTRKSFVLVLTATLLISTGCDTICRYFGLPAETCNALGRFGTRQVQDLQVAVEVRFISVEDDFFERIGVDFDFRLDSDAQLVPANDDPPQLPTNLPANSFLANPSQVGGQQGALMLVPQLLGGGSVFLPAILQNQDPPQASHFPGLPIIRDLPITNIFSRPDLNNLPGGAMLGTMDTVDATSIGFAILSDIEAFFFLQAAQSDTRNNILVAPRLTLFNGQPAHVISRNERTIIADVQPEFAAEFLNINPQTTGVTSGPMFKLTPVMSADRRFVQLDIRPIVAAVGDADSIQVGGADRRLQFPVIQLTTVQTTVSVPDGGTVLLGGIKTVPGGTLQPGVPILNKLPYINRLFKNEATLKDTQSLMIMVTPRIVVQEEEEQ
jgi:general secretion pathway protein D